MTHLLIYAYVHNFKLTQISDKSLIMDRIDNDIHDDSTYGFFDEIDNECNCCDNYWKTDQKQNLKLSKTSSLSSTVSTTSLSSTSSSYASAHTIICEIKDSLSSTSCRSFEHSNNNAHKSIFVCISMEAFRLIQNDLGEYMNEYQHILKSLTLLYIVLIIIYCVL